MATSSVATAPLKLWQLACAVIVPLVLVIALMIGANVLMVGRVVFDSAAYLASTLVLAVLFHGFGGWLSAALARDNRSAALWVVILGFALMAQSVDHTWPTVPPWYSLCMLVIAPAFLWTGTRLHLRRASAAR